MPRKNFDCSKCGGSHPRPINSKCKLESQNNEVNEASAYTMDTNSLILQELKSLSGRMAEMERKVDGTVHSPASSVASTSKAPTPAEDSEEEDDELILPSIKSLQQSKRMQAQVDQRIQQLKDLNEQGKFKSQRGGKDTVWVKKEVPWPHNFILGGSNKNRVTYDALSMSQWVSGFAQIVREESNEAVKNYMLDYLAELMEDSHDFGWQSAKGSHAVLLCRMEDNKIQWQDTQKIDRLRRVHAQRMAPTPQTKRITAKGPLVCKFYQRGSCMQKGDHENNGQMYLHVCQHCYAQGKSYPHSGKDCKNKSKNDLGTA